MEPKSIPKRYKIEVDFQERKKVVQTPSWRPLEAILRHFGSHLGSKKSQKVLENAMFREKFTFSTRKRFEDDFGTNLGRPSRQNDRK